MNVKRTSQLALAVIAVLGSSTGLASQPLVDQISQFGVSYQVTDNHAALNGVDCAVLGADWASCNRATITLTNNGPTITSKNWAIYMSNVHKTLAVQNDQFRMVHIVGDLTRLEPTDKFVGLAPGASVVIPLSLIHI